MSSYALALWCAGKALGGFMGGFFTFAGVSKTSGAHGLVTIMSEEMQGGFRSGSFAKIFGVPATLSLPLLYTVGCTEMLAGTTILGYVFGVVPATYAQWASSIAAFITLNATGAHVARGDGPAAIQFCAVMCTLFTVLTFVIAAQRGKAKGA